MYFVSLRLSSIILTYQVYWNTASEFGSVIPSSGVSGFYFFLWHLLAPSLKLSFLIFSITNLYLKCLSGNKLGALLKLHLLEWEVAILFIVMGGMLQKGIYLNTYHVHSLGVGTRGIINIIILTILIEIKSQGSLIMSILRHHCVSTKEDDFHLDEHLFFFFNPKCN